MKNVVLNNKKAILVITSTFLSLILIGIALFSIVGMSNKNVKASIEEHTLAIDGQYEEPKEELPVVELEEPQTENTVQEETKKDKSTPKVTGSTPYYIRVNNQANVVTVYGKDEEGNYTVPVKAMICSTGSATPRSGKYKIPGSKSRWRALYGGVYGQYVTNIVGAILFHSVPYTQIGADCLEWWEYDKLGTSASMGCVRLTVVDAQWVYNNISSGTTVEFYSDSNPGPLGKPSAQKISGNVECRDWDPTDGAEGNPWRGSQPQEQVIEQVQANTPAPAVQQEPPANTSQSINTTTQPTTVETDSKKEENEKQPSEETKPTQESKENEGDSASKEEPKDIIEPKEDEKEN